MFIHLVSYSHRSNTDAVACCSNINDSIHYCDVNMLMGNVRFGDFNHAPSVTASKHVAAYIYKRLWPFLPKCVFGNFHHFHLEMSELQKFFWEFFPDGFEEHKRGIHEAANNDQTHNCLHASLSWQAKKMKCVMVPYLLLEKTNEAKKPKY